MSQALTFFIGAVGGIAAMVAFALFKFCLFPALRGRAHHNRLKAMKANRRPRSYFTAWLF